MYAQFSASIIIRYSQINNKKIDIEFDSKIKQQIFLSKNNIHSRIDRLERFSHMSWYLLFNEREPRSIERERFLDRLNICIPELTITTQQDTQIWKPSNRIGFIYNIIGFEMNTSVDASRCLTFSYRTLTLIEGNKSRYMRCYEINSIKALYFS